MMGWVMFWLVVAIVNVASLLNHIANGTEPYLALAGVVCSGAMLGYYFARWGEGR